MKAVDILNNLKIYQSLIEEIYQKETALLKNKEGFVKLTKELSCSYRFIRLELRLLTKGNSEDTNFNESFFCEIEFEVSYNNIVAYKKLYCEDKSREEEIDKLIKEKVSANIFVWSTVPGNDFYINKEITESLNIADEIAQQAYNCASGDDYRPGFFSKISIQDDAIRLDQINHMNAKSLAHKNDYSLRKLEFLLAFLPMEKTYRYEYQIGNLLIGFSDSSSENNKPCGKAIETKIEEVIIRYGKK